VILPDFAQVSLFKNTQDSQRAYDYPFYHSSNYSYVAIGFDFFLNVCLPPYSSIASRTVHDSQVPPISIYFRSSADTVNELRKVTSLRSAIRKRVR